MLSVKKREGPRMTPRVSADLIRKMVLSLPNARNRGGEEWAVKRRWGWEALSGTTVSN
jgi:hypothetical protein